MKENFYSRVAQLINCSKECITAFRIGDDGLGYTKIIELIEKMDVFVGILNNLESLDDSVKNIILNMNSILLNINEAIMNRDSILVSDLIEFELIPIIELFKDPDCLE